MPLDRSWDPMAKQARRERPAAHLGSAGMPSSVELDATGQRPAPPAQHGRRSRSSGHDQSAPHPRGGVPRDGANVVVGPRWGRREVERPSVPVGARRRTHRHGEGTRCRHLTGHHCHYWEGGASRGQLPTVDCSGVPIGEDDRHRAPCRDHDGRVHPAIRLPVHARPPGWSPDHDQVHLAGVVGDAVCSCVDTRSGCQTDHQATEGTRRGHRRRPAPHARPGTA